MKLLISQPVLPQIQAARKVGKKICLDGTKEALGDKVAIVTVATWLRRMLNEEIILLETAPGRTPFLFSNYELPEGLVVEEMQLGIPLEHLDVLKSGANDSLWVLNPYLATLGIHPKIKLKEPATERDEIVFIPLHNPLYNQRRGMDLAHVGKTINYLREIGFNLTVITDFKSEHFESIQLPFNEVVERIAGAKIFIGGDTGFSHLACALGTPAIAIYPDWFVVGKSDMRDAATIGEWWGIPSIYTPYSFIPNAPHEKLRVVELASDHTFSIAHVEANIEYLADKKKKPPTLVIPAGTSNEELETIHKIIT